MMGQTLIEKIIAHNIGREKVTPGEIVTVNVDRVMVHDIFIPFVADKLCRQASAFTFDKLKTIYNRLLEFDYQFKTSQTDPEAALDLFILDVAQLQKKR